MSRLLPNLRYEGERLAEEKLQQVGTVYLICLSRPFGHMRHYIGWSSCPRRRLYHHRRGTGAHVLKFVVAAGIKLRIVRQWPEATRLFERYLKMRREAAYFCPRCRAAKMRRRRRAARARRELLKKSKAVGGLSATPAGLKNRTPAAGATGVSISQRSYEPDPEGGGVSLRVG